MTLLTAEDVLNKKFQPTKFREGYDQDEVDDFLDDVVSTLRALTSENEQLRGNLAAAQARIAELGGDGASAQRSAPVALAEAEPVDEVPEEPAAVQAEAEPVGEVPEEPAAVQAGPETAAAAPSGGGEEPAPQSAAGMLALAQRVHDEYVANGQRESERLVSEARAQADSLVQEAEEQRTETLQRLTQERVELEQKIDELREFERDYRSRLKTYLEGLLQDVEGTSVSSDGSPRTIA